MTVIQKCWREEMVKVVQAKMLGTGFGLQPWDVIENHLIVLESVGLISFPQEVNREHAIEYDVPTIHAAAMHITSGTSLGTKWSIDGNVAVAMLLDLVKAGFRISRDKKASEDEVVSRLRARGVLIEPVDGSPAQYGPLDVDSALALIRYLRDMGFEIVKTG